MTALNTLYLCLNKTFSMISINKESLAECFMRYARIDTQSDPKSGTHPSTEKQKNLGNLLVQ